MKQNTIIDLQTLGYAHVEYKSAYLSMLLHNFLGSWKNVVSAYRDHPYQLVELFPFKDDGGFELKQYGEAAGSGDKKWDFHVTPYRFEELCSRVIDGTLIKFFKRSCQVNEQIKYLMTDFIKDLASISEVDFSEDMLDYLNRCPIRSLHYLSGQKPGTEIAAQHCDRGMFTLTLTEDLPGLEFFCPVNREWRPIQNKPGKMMLMPGLGLQRITNGVIKALPHRVVAGLDARRLPRNSQVMFFDLPFAKYSDFLFNKRAKGAASKLGKDGWNFDMETAAFNKFFGGFPEGATGVD